MAENTEQWKGGGDCSICRRQKYCGNPCRPAQGRKERKLAALITRAMLKGMADAYEKSSE